MKKLLFIVGVFFMFSCGDKPDVMFTAPSSAEVNKEIIVKFTNPISSTEKSKYWITIIEKSKEDKDWGKWQYVKDNAESIKLICPSQAGEYEIRLHDMYPSKSFHVVERASLTLK
ncbi:MAG: hypothetical protein L3J35_10930 [Bacteroidales bacterium]|nr:hypothetical protein [Bacteroidales bacterium]